MSDIVSTNYMFDKCKCGHSRLHHVWGGDKSKCFINCPCTEFIKEEEMPEFDSTAKSLTEMCKCGHRLVSHKSNHKFLWCEGRTLDGQRCICPVFELKEEEMTLGDDIGTADAMKKLSRSDSLSEDEDVKARNYIQDLLDGKSPNAVMFAAMTEGLEVSQSGSEIFIGSYSYILPVETKDDPVNHPSHYTQYNGLEVIQLTEQMNFNRGNAVKYICRAGFKGDASTEVQDLEKAAFYIAREIERLKSES